MTLKKLRNNSPQLKWIRLIYREKRVYKYFTQRVPRHKKWNEHKNNSHECKWYSMWE